MGPGDEVITTPNTFIATVGAIVAAGARPVFVDCTEEYVIDPDLIESATTSHTKALIPVHFAGVPADMDRIMPIAHRHGLPVIEDSCQAIQGALNGKMHRHLGLTGAFSLHPLKNLNVWGDSGIIITDSEPMRDRLRLLRNHGLQNRDEVVIFGYNSRLDTVQAAVGNQLIQEIDWITATRIKWANKLDQALGSCPMPLWCLKDAPPTNAMSTTSTWCRPRTETNSWPFSRIGGSKPRSIILSLHLQRAAYRLGYKEGDFPVAEAQARSIITLPVHQHLEEPQIDYMIDKIREFYR